MLTTREQGDLGELSALDWLVSQGAHCYLPFGHSPDVDLIADFGDRVLRVQVKSCAYALKNRWAVTLSTRGGNQSWSGEVKKFSPTRCDALFVLAGDGRRWFIPADRVAGGTAILLGGPKYAAYEVEPGRPIVGR